MCTTRDVPRTWRLPKKGKVLYLDVGGDHLWFESIGEFFIRSENAIRTPRESIFNVGDLRMQSDPVDKRCGFGDFSNYPSPFQILGGFGQG